MNKIILLGVLFLTQIVSAQSNKAKNLLDEVHKKVTSYQNIYIDFRYTLDNSKVNTKQEIRGNVTLQGDKYVLNYMGATKIFDGNQIYTIIPENEEVTIEPADSKDPNNIMPSEMLTFYKKGYNYKWDIEQNIKGRKIQYIELKPIKANSDIKQILLGIDTLTKHIYNLIQIGKNDTRTTIIINEFKTNQPLPSNQFSFDEDKYKKEGYYISKF